MPSLSLPPELLDMIILETMPEGFACLASSCRSLHGLCQPFIEQHRRLCNQYSRIRYGAYYTDPEDNEWTAFNLLARIARRPVIARYIQRADFRWDSWDFDKRPRPPLQVDIDDPEYGGKIAKMLADSHYLQYAGLDWQEYWLQIKKELTNPTPSLRDFHFSQHAAAFVLTLLPNVKTVMLPSCWIKNVPTYKLTHEIYDRAMRSQASGSYSLGRCTKVSGQTSKMESMWSVPFENLPHALSRYVPHVCPWRSMPLK